MRIVVISTTRKRKAMPSQVCIYVRNGIELPAMGEKVYLELNGESVKTTRVKSVNPDARTYTIPVDV